MPNQAGTAGRPSHGLKSGGSVTSYGQHRHPQAITGLKGRIAIHIHQLQAQRQNPQALLEPFTETTPRSGVEAQRW